MNRIERKKVVLPTYCVGEAEPLPVYFEKRPYQGASGKVYPIPYTAKLSDEKKDREYDAVVLENEYLRAVLLPEIGGKIHSILDKTNGYDIIYNNKVIKPAMVGLAGPWVAGGIEFNFPQHHRPTTFLPAECAVKGNTAYMGEFDYFHGMKGMIALSLEGARVKAEITVYNPTAEEHPFLWWANMAVEVNDDYKIVFPPDVEYVNDHDRRAVLEWPVARGVYHTARPYDYGTGTDIHAFPAVKVPSSFMVSRGQSDADFVCGYDVGRQAGVVTVADRRVAPGKKLWTWGDGKFGAKWCSNLTDDGSRYVELMTGCYTDNQPDFTWIAPYERKKFVQYWYPVREIGEVKAANADCAVNLEERDGALFAGVYSVSPRALEIILEGEGKEIIRARAEVSPDKPWTESVHTEIPLSALTLTVREGEKTLLSYRPPKRGKKKPIVPRKPALPPREISSVEELWLNGTHLRQYKHFAYRAEDYFLEGLSRDGGDIRCNKSMGDLLLARGQYAQAEERYSAAIGRLTLRNENPYDTEPYYKRALCKFARKDYDGAYEDAYAAVWSYPLRSAGYYLLAKIESLRNNPAAAEEFLSLSLETNANHLWAEYARGLIAGEKGIEEKIADEDPLFLPDGSERRAVAFAVELMQFGLYQKAEEVLLKAEDGALKFYHLAELYALTGREEERKTVIARADSCPYACEFPSLRESESALKGADTPMANYYLGCLYYSLERYEEGCVAWEKTAAKLDFAPAYRNLSLGYFDHLSRPERARECLERAYALDPGSGRIFYELTKLYKSLNLPLEERLALYRGAPARRAERDDCTLDYSVLLTQEGKFEEAEAVLASHRFHTYEGGEGYLTQHHAWLHFLSGEEAEKAGKYEEAIARYESGLVFPENYGEEKNYFVNDAPLYLGIAHCKKALGDEAGEKEALALAVSTKGAPTVHSYWQCLAYRAAGEKERAERLAEEMIHLGKERVANAERDDYFGVGAPAYPPFGYDVKKAHTLSGSLLQAFGALAAGDKKTAIRLYENALSIDCADFTVRLLERVLRG